jgi:beta-glucosidase
MNCESDSDVKGSCRGQLDIAATLAKLPQGEWSEISVNLHCFTKQGVKFDKIVVPFEIVSRAPLALSISEIEFVPNKAHLATVQCQ